MTSISCISQICAKFALIFQCNPDHQLPAGPTSPGRSCSSDSITSGGSSCSACHSNTLMNPVFLILFLYRSLYPCQLYTKRYPARSFYFTELDFIRAFLSINLLNDSLSQMIVMYPVANLKQIFFHVFR